MKNQVVKPSILLTKWAEKYKNVIGEKAVHWALETADLCYLAFATILNEVETLPHSFPKEAIISSTCFGKRPPNRSSTAQPAAFAAYFLERNGFPKGVAIKYLETLLGLTLMNWDYNKYKSTCNKKVIKAAKAVESVIINNLTIEKIEKDCAEAKEILAELEGKVSENIQTQIISAIRARPILLHAIKSGKFDHLPPEIGIGTIQRLGRDMALAPCHTNKFQFQWPPDYVTPLGAYIYSVPAWFSLWTGRKVTENGIVNSCKDS